MTVTVILTDGGLGTAAARAHFTQVDWWAQETCESYGGHDIVEVADVSPEHDLMCEYRFEDERDVVFFRLRWS